MNPIIHKIVQETMGLLAHPTSQVVVLLADYVLIYYLLTL